MFEYVQEREHTTRLEPRTMVYVITLGEMDKDNPEKLSDRGKNQVQELANSRLVTGVSRIYSSPASVAVETSNILKKEFYCNVEKKECLIELELGIPWTDEDKLRETLQRLWEDEDFKPNNGESMSEARSRIRDCLNEIGLRHQGDSVAIVTHPLTSNLLHSLVTGVPSEIHDWLMSGFASCASYEHTKAGWILVMPPDNSFLTDPSTIADILPDNLVD
ncbi:histidine phosphatase family protein [Candidatus Thorarchaeota archaeon]|nr:MAG: histidine phosphatase family protein [Candidatus Thorarchaeota archaeon]